MILETFAQKINSHSTILVDLDGTLVDTDVANSLAYLQAIKEILGVIPYSLERLKNKRITKDTLVSVNISKIDEIILRKTTTYQNYLDKTILNQDLAAIIKLIAQSNSKIYLVTSSMQRRAIETLNHHNMEMYFSQVFCQKTQKYKYAINQLMTPVSDIFVFEDNLEEIISCLNLGIPRENIYHISKTGENYA